MRRLISLIAVVAVLTLVASAPALADRDPFSQPSGSATSASTGNSSSLGGRDPFAPLPGSGPSSTSTGGATSGSTGSGGQDQASGGGTGPGEDSGSQQNGPAKSLPFTGADPTPWLVIAYGLLAAGAVALIAAESFGVSRRRRRVLAAAGRPRSDAARSGESSR